MRLRLEPWVFLVLLGGAAQAADTATIRAQYPHLFHETTGYRIERQRGPTPQDIPPPARIVDAREARRAIDAGAVALDVFGAPQSRFDELDGTWLVREPRDSLPGAVWLPEVGRGVLSADMQTYLARNLERLTDGDPDRPLVIFCVADCWMSWNAAQRVAELGYREVLWFRLGTDGWLDEGWPLAPTDPVPVDVE